MPTTEIVKPAETQRRRRGHNFFPPKADLRKIPALYSTEGTHVDEKTVHLHYFSGAWDWFITEIDTETFEAFGYARHAGDGEWGYIDLRELEAVRGGLIPVERDLFWEPVTFAEAAK